MMGLMSLKEESLENLFPLAHSLSISLLSTTPCTLPAWLPSPIWEHSRKAAVCNLKDASSKPYRTCTLISDFQPLELWKDTFLLFKCYSVYGMVLSWGKCVLNILSLWMLVIFSWLFNIANNLDCNLTLCVKLQKSAFCYIILRVCAGNKLD